MISKIKRLGRYELRDHIGSGSMAKVYRAYDPVKKIEVALKALHPHMAQDEDIVKGFRKEAQAASALSHPNINQVFEYGYDDGSYYIAMAYVPTGTLKDLLQRRGVLSPTEAVGLLAPIARALHQTHLINLIHRDIKPANILIDEWSNPILTDFGIARIRDGETITGTRLGGQNYMSPEQVQGETVYKEADIYCLGLVLYQAVTGRGPFQGEMLAVMHQHVYEAPIPPRVINPAIPPKLEAVILKALAKKPKDRFASAEKMALAMENSLIESNRSPAALMVATVIGALLLILIGVSILYFQ